MSSSTSPAYSGLSSCLALLALDRQTAFNDIQTGKREKAIYTKESLYQSGCLSNRWNQTQNQILLYWWQYLVSVSVSACLSAGAAVSKNFPKAAAVDKDTLVSDVCLACLYKSRLSDSHPPVKEGRCLFERQG